MEWSDAAQAATDSAPSLLAAGVRVGCALALLVGLASLWLWWHKRGIRISRQLEVLERTVLARGASLALVRVGAERLLVGISGDGVRLIKELGGAADELPRTAPSSFQSTLTMALGRRDPS